MMCPRCGDTLLYRPPVGRTVWCARKTANLDGERVPCGYRAPAPGYFAAKNDPRQGQLL